MARNADRTTTRLRLSHPRRVRTCGVAGVMALVLSALLACHSTVVPTESGHGPLPLPDATPIAWGGPGPFIQPTGYPPVSVPVLAEGTPTSLYLRAPNAKLLVARSGATAWGLLVPDDGPKLLQRWKGVVRADESIALVKDGPPENLDGPSLGALGGGSAAAATGTPVTLVVRKMNWAACEAWIEDGAGHKSDVTPAQEVVLWQDPGTELTMALVGRLGTTLDVRLQLRRDSAALDGFLRRAGSPDELRVKGLIDPFLGVFSLEERNADRVVTGRWAGAFFSPSVAAGTWTSADGTKSLPFVLKVDSNLEERVIQGADGVTVRQRVVQERMSGDCRKERDYPEVHGLVPEERNAKANAALGALVGAGQAWTEGSCAAGGRRINEELVAATATAESGGVLALTVSHWKYEKGMYRGDGWTCQLFDLETLEVFDLDEVLGKDVEDALEEKGGPVIAKFWKEKFSAGSPKKDAGPRYCYEDPRHVSAVFNTVHRNNSAPGNPIFTYDVTSLVARMPAGPSAQGALRAVGTVHIDGQLRARERGPGPGDSGPDGAVSAAPVPTRIGHHGRYPLFAGADLQEPLHWVRVAPRVRELSVGARPPDFEHVLRGDRLPGRLRKAAVGCLRRRREIWLDDGIPVDAPDVRRRPFRVRKCPEERLHVPRDRRLPLERRRARRVDHRVVGDDSHHILLVV